MSYLKYRYWVVTAALSGKVEINSEDEKTDDDDFPESEMGSVEEHRTLIIQLLSQLKLGMDLTQVYFIPAYHWS